MAAVPLIAGGALLVPAGAANAATPLFTATTHITNNPDSGGHGVWATDGPGSDHFTRVLRVYNASTSACVSAGLYPSPPANTSCYTATVTDSGPFQTVLNAYQPNQSIPQTGDTITHIVKGTFSGTADYTFWTSTSTPPNAALVPANRDDGNIVQTGRDSTSKWFAQAFPASDVAIVTDGVILNTWSWTYTTGCETWADSFANHDGQSVPISDDGNITGKVCPPVVPDVVTVTNPGTRTTPVGTAISPLALSASSSKGDAITSWSSTALPAGLSLDSATGVISGTPTASGSTSVTVTAKDSAGTTGSATFTWAVTLGVKPPPPPPVSSYGDEVNPYGNGFDAYRQHQYAGAVIAGWTATQGDPATHFIRKNGTAAGAYQFEYAPHGAGTGLCVSDPGGGWSSDPLPDGLILTNCNHGPWQQFIPQAGGTLKNVATGLVVNPDGTGAQLRGGASPTPWGGSKYDWTPYSSLP